jgi:hypothetical protein
MYNRGKNKSKNKNKKYSRNAMIKAMRETDVVGGREVGLIQKIEKDCVSIIDKHNDTEVCYFTYELPKSKHLEMDLFFETILKDLPLSVEKEGIENLWNQYYEADNTVLIIVLDITRTKGLGLDFVPVSHFEKINIDGFVWHRYQGEGKFEKKYLMKGEDFDTAGDWDDAWFENEIN